MAKIWSAGQEHRIFYFEKRKDSEVSYPGAEELTSIFASWQTSIVEYHSIATELPLFIQRESMSVVLCKATLLCQSLNYIKSRNICIIS